MDEAVFDSLSDPVVRRTSAEGPITFLNRAAEQAYGWTRSELREIHVGDPLRTEYQSPLTEIAADLQREGSWEGRLVRHAKDGRPVPVSSRWLRTAHLDGGSSLVQIDRPLSSAGGAGRSSGDRDEIFGLLVASVEEYAIFVLDPEGRVVTWNVGAERLKQYRRDEVLGRHFSIFYEPEDAAAGRPQQVLARAAAEGHYGEEGWRVRKDGSRFWAGILLTALRDESGGLRGFAKITRDLTEKHAQIERLAELEAVKSQFLRLASHELGGPLAILRGYLSMLQEGMWGEPTAEQAKAYAVLDGKARHMVWLVNQLLEAARLEDGDVPWELRPLDLRTVVRKPFDDARALAPPSHRLVLTVPDHPVIVRADERASASVVENLLSNAIKYSPRGGTVNCEVTTAGADALVKVTDTGIGISEADMPKLFTRFGRIITPQNSDIPGVGLGLYLSRELARRQGGDLNATSVDGSGSTFELTLKRA